MRVDSIRRLLCIVGDFLVQLVILRRGGAFHPIERMYSLVEVVGSKRIVLGKQVRVV